MRRLVLPVVFAGLLACGSVALLAQRGAPVSEAARLEGMAARFAPTDITVDLSKHSAAERQVLGKLVEASKIMDAIFLRQVWAGNEAMHLELSADRSEIGRAHV